MSVSEEWRWVFIDWIGNENVKYASCWGFAQWKGDWGSGNIFSECVK